MATLHWVDQSSQILPADALPRDIRQQLGHRVETVVTLPRGALGAADPSRQVESAAQAHLVEVERAQRLGRLGDLTGITHLEPYLRTFLDDHPDPTRNVFIMMRFTDTAEMKLIHEVLVAALGERGFEGIRADDRDYTGELWTNIEVCMACSQFGVAVFEDIEVRDFNPNVSLELGHMLGRQRRILILKEKRLPDLPTDVIHRLYKPFDMFQIEDTIRSQVLRWLDVDLGGTR
ncbi:MAG: hypothetical protein ACYDGR_08435 [Candidatus Dormibacteria bacterium]